jgi:hypothetical protein
MLVYGRDTSSHTVHRERIDVFIIYWTCMKNIIRAGHRRKRAYRRPNQIVSFLFFLDFKPPNPVLRRHCLSLPAAHD